MTSVAPRSLPFAYAERFEQVRALLPGRGTPWLATLRDEAIERFRAQGLPSVRVEEWKFTSLRRFAQGSFEPASHEAPALPPGLIARAEADLGGHRLVFSNGHRVASQSSIGALPAGVRLTSLAEALEREPERVEETLGRLAADEGDALILLNTAFMADGCVLDVADGAALDEPVHLIFVGNGVGRAAHPRILVRLGRNAHATLIETHLGAASGGPYWSNPASEIALGEGAMLRHYKIQDEAETAYHLASSEVVLAAGSRYENAAAAIGAGLSRNEIRVRFEGARGDCRLNGVYLLRGEQHGDATTVIDHAHPQCTSREVYKGVLAGKAHGVFQGRILVRPGAQKTDGHQLSRTLLLSREAAIDTKPELEIFANDVKCSHGATVGELDADALFYLRARGLDAERARSLLVEAFVGEVLDGITLAAVGDHLRTRVAEWLGHGGGR